MTKYKCTICGWIYDPEVGVSSQKVEPGTPWDEVDSEFKCPKCGAVKKWFEAIEG